MFFRPGAKTILLALLCGVICAYTGGLMSAAFKPIGLPTLTLPYACKGLLSLTLSLCLCLSLSLSLSLVDLLTL